MFRLNRGQGSMEAIIALPVLLLAFFILVQLGYRQVLFLAVDYHLHESLVCATTHSLKKCEQEFTKRIAPLLLNRESLQIHLGEDLAFFYARAELNLEPTLTIHKKLLKRWL